tara:strand:+ start:1159 stop:2496 length:1338 start_codon:yes stop_codon:yes gene_type:complete
MEKVMLENAQVIAHELDWFIRVINHALTVYFQNDTTVLKEEDLALPEYQDTDAPYKVFITENQLSFEERIVLMMALVQPIKPQLFDVFQIKNQNLDQYFVEFGGEHTSQGFIPTLQTAFFVLGGDEVALRTSLMKWLHQGHFLFSSGILNWNNEEPNPLHQRLQVSEEYLGYFLHGERKLPQYSSQFPAKAISTELDWEDLVVNDQVMADLQDIKSWLVHAQQILEEWGLKSRLKKGYRALFYGPPGTGKTFAATLLGKSTGKAVFRVDLSLVVSKYIGETEKNLGKLFDEAENKDWILFFDEADALFGKRTQTKGANDRYANQEVAYLLQRIEDFSGLVILATNIQTNIDEAFARRFQSMVYFSSPDVEARKKLWQSFITEPLQLDGAVNLDEIAERYELSGGEMINVLRFCALEAAKRNNTTVLQPDLLQGIKREYQKSNKTL